METAIKPFPSTTSHPSNTVEQPQTIKMEDLEQSLFQQNSTAASTPSPSFMDLPDTPKASDSRSTKKRKSWGQVLPEPKTNLPPRKRAKTADEKEQRRIERVKRNRLAAHNSRERKRQEVDALQAEKAALEQRVKDMETELSQYRQLLPQANIPKAPELQAPNFTLLDAYNDSHANMAAPSQGSLESPDSLLSTMDSPVDSEPSTPKNEMIANEPDLTQHSAVMLWDLQCRSGISSSIISTPNLRYLLAYLINFNILSFMRMISSMVSLTSISSQRAVMAWLATQNLFSTLASKAQLPVPSLATQTIFWFSLMQTSSICSPTQARLLQSATRAALRRRAFSSKSIHASTGSAYSAVDAAGLERSRKESNRRTIDIRTQRLFCINRMAMDIKRRCRVIDIQSRARLSESGRQKAIQKMPRR